MIIARLLRFAVSYRRELALSVLFGLLAVASNVGLLAVSAYLISAAALKPLLVTLSIPLYVVRAGGVVRAVTRYTERLTAHNVAFRLIAHIRTWLFTGLIPLAPARLLAYRSGDVMARLIADLEELEQLYVRSIAPLAVATLAAATATIILAVVHPVLGVSALTFILIALCGVPWLVLRLLRQIGETEVSIRAEIQAHLVDGVQGLADLEAFGAVVEHATHLAALDDALSRLQQRRAAIGGLQHGAMILLAGLCALLVLVLAIPLVRAGTVGGILLATLPLLVFGVFEAIAPVGMAIQQLGRAAAAGRRLFELADAPPAVAEVVAPQRWPSAAALTFDNVNFTYVAGEVPALLDITFSLRPRSRLAVVGASGSGKSTLARLALRMYDPDVGTILFGEHRLADYALHDLRAAIGLVPQVPYLFSDTLRNNLLLGRPGATDEEVGAAIWAACLEDVVAGLPDGVDTWVGADGARLSGGERQRVAIARTLLAQPRLLILDEATANLDPQTERAVLDRLLEPSADHAVLLISHRLIGMEDMDEILVMDQGRIVERGRHAALAMAGGLYAALLAAQNDVFTDESVSAAEPLTEALEA